MLFRNQILRLCYRPAFQCHFITKKDWALIKDRTNWSRYMDDLNLNAETYHHTTAKDLLKAVKDNPDNEFYWKTIGQLLYQMGKDGLQDEAVYRKIEKSLYKFKGEFSPRLAFGALCGFIALSIDNQYMHEFFDAELRMRWKGHDWLAAIDMMEACGKNKTLSREYLFQLMKTFSEPILISAYKEKLRYKPGIQLKLLETCISAKYFEPELFDPLISDIVKQQKINRLPTWLKLWKTLVKLETEGDFPRSIQPQIDILVNRLKNIPKYVWIYNFDENRYRTMKELKSIRENAPVQHAGYHLLQPEYMEQYIQRKAEGNDDVVIREKKLIQEKVLDDLLYDEFMLKKVEEQQQKKDAKLQKKGFKDEAEELEDEELSVEERQELLNDFQKQHLETLNFEDANPEDIPEEWLLEQTIPQDDEFSELDQRIKEAQENKELKQVKQKLQKRRKGRSGRDGIEI